MRVSMVISISMIPFLFLLACTPATPTMPSDSTEKPEVESHLMISDDVWLEPLSDDLAIDYPDIWDGSFAEVRRDPLEKYGLYYSDKFFLEGDSYITISLESDCPVGANLEGYQFDGGIWLQVEYIKEQEPIKTYHIMGIEEGDLKGSSGSWEAEYGYRASKTGYYTIMLTNGSGKSASCAFQVTEIK